MSRIVILCAALLTASAVQARPADLSDWQGARWGMTAAELDHLPGVTRLPAPFEFSGARATRGSEATVGEVPMLALFQMANGSGRLQQVLLETRRKATPAAHRQVAEVLREALGPPDATCVQTKDFGDASLVEQVWRFPSTVVHATLMDFTTTMVVTRDPNAALSAITPPASRNNWRGFPRRIIVRYHPAERLDLWGTCGR